MTVRWGWGWAVLLWGGDHPGRGHRAQVAALRAPEGAYCKASASGAQRELARLQPEMDRLTKIAAGS